MLNRVLGNAALSIGAIRVAAAVLALLVTGVATATIVHTRGREIEQ